MLRRVTSPGAKSVHIMPECYAGMLDGRQRRGIRFVVCQGPQHTSSAVAEQIRTISGLSSHPAGGYDKWTQAGDIRAVLDKLGIDRADIVGHDIGAMVAMPTRRAIRTRQAARRQALSGSVARCHQA